MWLNIYHNRVTKYRDGDLWAGGKWTNQSLEEQDGLADYAGRGDSVRDEDIVVWHTFGMTHNPRVEDFPVMPVEVSTIALKPADFFTANPALDVPQSTQTVNQSVLVADPLPSVAKTFNTGSASCCGGDMSRPGPKSVL